MTNIEILEELIKKANLEDVDMNDVFYGEHIKAIENLIKENKELKEKAKNTMGLIGANYIHKDKVKEKIEEIFNEMDELDEEEFDEDIVNDKRNLQDTIIVLKELLKEGDK